MTNGFLTGLSLLIVDDNRLVASSYGRWLVQLEPAWTFVSETNAQRALELLSNGAFHAALVDVHLNQTLDGLAICRSVRAAGIGTALLALSADETDAVRLAAIDAGADDYVAKGTTVRDLRARIVLACSRPRFQGAASRVHCRPGPLTGAERLFLDVLREQGQVSPERAAEIVLQRRDSGAVTALYKLVDKLRRKLGAQGEHIQTVRGHGYRWSPRAGPGGTSTSSNDRDVVCCTITGPQQSPQSRTG